MTNISNELTEQLIFVYEEAIQAEEENQREDTDSLVLLNDMFPDYIDSAAVRKLIQSICRLTKRNIKTSKKSVIKYKSKIKTCRKKLEGGDDADNRN